MEERITVRVKNSPDRIGVMNLSKTRGDGKKKKVLVHFNDGKAEYFFEKYLEPIIEQETPEDLIAKGQFAGIDQLRLCLTFERLNGRLANLIYSMESTNTDFYPFQFKPVLNFLNSPSGGLLIADEVGLGKTIEAGLIWTEVRARFDAKRLLIVCPAMLREKWRDEMQLRFGLKPQIADASEVLTTLKKHEKGVIHEFCLIASMQGLRPRRRWKNEDETLDAASQLSRYLDENELSDPLFDMVIIDEAHYLRNTESMTSKLGRILRPVTSNLLLLSATPVQTKQSDLFTLLNIIDETSFLSEHHFDAMLRANTPLLQLKDDLSQGKVTKASYESLLRTAARSNLFSRNRQLKQLVEDIPSQKELEDNNTRSRLLNQIDRINLLSSVVSRTRKRDVHEQRVIRDPISEVIEMTPLEQQLYTDVTEQVRCYCARHNAFEGFLLATPQRQLCSSMPAAIRSWRKKANIQNQDIELDIEDPENTANPNIGPLISALLQTIEKYSDLDELTINDTKLNRLKSVLNDFYKAYPDEKVVLFSYYRETLYYLEERLKEEGISSIVLVGGMKESKHEIIKRFRSDTSARILLSSEVASEGVDLQFCRVLLNYDLPWNPMKVEQRIGRIDRLGQKSSKITIWNLFYGQTIDQKIYQRLLMRLGIFESAIGSMEGVIGDEIKKMSIALLKDHLNAEEEIERIEQTEQALANLKRQNEILENEAAGLVAHGDFILNRVKAAKELQRYVTNKDLYLFFCSVLNKYFPGSQVIEKKSDNVINCDIELTTDAKMEISEYFQANKHERSILSRESNGRTKVVFDNQQIATKDRRISIGQFHPIIKFLLNKKHNNRDINNSPVAIMLPSIAVPEIKKNTYAFIVTRWAVEGVSTIEQLEYALCNLSSKKLYTGSIAEKVINLSLSDGSNWIDASRELDDVNHIINYIDECDDELDSRYNEFINQMKLSNIDRADVQIFNVEQHYGRKIERLQNFIAERDRIGNTKMRAAYIGKLNKLKERKLSLIEKYEGKKEITHEKSKVVIGVINIR
ncbi:SNF2-related protein [uncultured Photobacterium sp.]|uniref:SNF2-related protein n=1 Tax=uncultured Photobacterium sp. TaxID=173973 RepID=UPI002622213E|nr:SNF2-related protein [uncultured Photobacterium sp.]